MAIFVGAVLAAMVGLVAHLVGHDRHRFFYPAVLIVIGSLYVLFAVIAGGQGLLLEIAGFAFFAALAVIGFRTSLWVVTAGLALHGVFDFVRETSIPASGAPVWWPAFCGSYDVVAALGLAALLLFERRGPKAVAGR